jgi:TfoX/Sxy family transcriptional regulator of competence genes
VTTADPAFLEGVVGDLAPLGAIEQLPYFGGVGLVGNYRQFAFVMGTSFYLATNNDTRESMRSLGGGPFEYMTKLGLRTVEAYYDTPVEVLRQTKLLLTWAQQALTARSTVTVRVTSSIRYRTRYVPRRALKMPASSLRSSRPTR